MELADLIVSDILAQTQPSGFGFLETQTLEGKLHLGHRQLTLACATQPTITGLLNVLFLCLGKPLGLFDKSEHILDHAPLQDR